LFAKTDFTNLDDTRIFYVKDGTDVLNYVRLGADDTVTPESVQGSFAFAVRDDDTGALQGFAWLPGNQTLQLRNLDNGSDTELAFGVTGVERAGFVDGKRILRVDGGLKSYDTGDESLSQVTQSATVRNLAIDRVDGETTNDGRDRLYLFAETGTSTTRLIEVDLDADPQAVQLADTGDDGFNDFLAGLGDDRIAWSESQGTLEVESFSLSDGSAVSLASGDSANALFDERAGGGFVFVSQDSRDDRAIDIGASGEVVLDVNGNGASAIEGGIWASDGLPFTHSRIAFSDAGGELVTVDRSSPGDTAQQVKLATVDTSTYSYEDVGSYQPDALVTLNRLASGEGSDIAYIDPAEKDSLTFLNQDPNVIASPVYGY